MDSLPPITNAHFSQALVDTFGSSLQEILNGPDAERFLRRCPGIGPSKARSIKRGWDEAHGSRAGFVFARGLGLAAVQAQTLADQYGQRLETALRADPYSVLQPLNMPLGYALFLVCGCCSWDMYSHIVALVHRCCRLQLHTRFIQD